MKKMIAVSLCLILLLSCSMTAFAAGDSYVVAGSSDLCNGELWAATSEANAMTARSDGTYVLVVKNIQPGNYEFKIVKNGSEWLGDPDNWGQNYSMTVKSACDITFVYDPSTGYATATGSGVTAPEAPEISVMSIRGEGLEYLDWNVGVAMTEVVDGVFEYLFTDLEDVDFSIKFAANGNWEDYNFGGTFNGPEEETEAVWSGENIGISVIGAYDILVTLDLTRLNYSTKHGAVFTISYIPVQDAPVQDPSQPDASEPDASQPDAPAPDQNPPATSGSQNPPQPSETVGSNASSDETVPGASSDKSQSDASPDYTVIILAAVAVAVVAALAVGVLLLRKRRK